MNWTTPEDAERAIGKRGRAAAIKCSILHWRQFVQATNEELRALVQGDKAEDPNRIHLSGSYCALCRYSQQIGCRICPLWQAGKGCNQSVDSPYNVASRSYQSLMYELGAGDEGGFASVASMFRESAAGVVSALEELRDDTV